MSRLTRTRTGYPSLTVKVGWSARSFDTMRCPASFAVLFTLSRSPTMMRLLL